MNTIIKQAKNHIRQQPFFTILSILGTAVSIAFAMLVVINYDIHIGDITPESNRSKMVYSGDGYSFKTKDHSNANPGMSYRTAKMIFSNIKGASIVSYQRSGTKLYCGTNKNKGESHFCKFVDPEFWQMYDFKFLAGKPFNKADFQARANVVVINEHIAREFYGSAEKSIGKTCFCDFSPMKIIGVVDNVSSFFNFAYSELWMPFDPTIKASDPLYGDVTAMALCAPGVSTSDLNDQLHISLKRYNSTLNNYSFELKDMCPITKYQFFKGHVNATAILFLIALMLLVVPAINISGLVSSQMHHQMSELAIRRCYGARRWQLIMRFINENLILTFIGSILGVIMSYAMLFIIKGWLLFSDTSLLNYADCNISTSMILRPTILLWVVGLAVLFNFISVFIPVWIATRRNIISTLKGE